jgi:glycosyltransferase involved in cell wall biosynthesis
VTLRVLAFTPAPESGAAGRYRVFQYREPLRALGIELEPAPFLDEDAFRRLYRPGGVAPKAWDVARRTQLLLTRLRSARRYDLVLVHRELWPLAGGWPLALLERSRTRWVFDLDDAVFLPNVSDANKRFAGLKAHGSVTAIAAGARAVAAGNAWLATWARNQRLGRPADEVEVIPTVVDSTHWTPATPDNGGTVRLLWIGSPTTLRYLEAWGPTLSRLGARHPGLELHVIGSRLELPGLRCFSHEWSADTERTISQRCHIGLAPLADGDWERGKCGLKLLLYMALGLPAVASRAGVHPEIVTPAMDGELVGDDESLEAALDRLVRDPARRAALGRAARRTLELRYSLKATAPRLGELLRRAADSHQAD